MKEGVEEFHSREAEIWMIGGTVRAREIHLGENREWVKMGRILY